MMSQPSHAQIHREVGYVQGTLAGVEKRLDNLETSVSEGFKEIKGLLSGAIDAGAAKHEAMDERITDLEMTEERRKGWLAAMTLVAGALGGAAAWIFDRIF